MKWYKIVSVLLATSFQGKINAQTFSVGDLSCNYKSINYNFPVNCPIYSSSSDTYALDIDGDLTYDISIKSSCNNWPSSNINSSISLISNTNFEFAFDTLTPFCPWSKSIKNLPVGTQLNNNLIWKSSPFLNPYVSGLYSYQYIAGNFFSCGQQTGFYVGFRKILITDTIYGWLLVNSSFPGSVVSYASKKSSEPVYVGPMIMNLPKTLCQYNDSIAINVNIPGGVFNNDPAIIGNTFYSSLSTWQGNHPIYYSCVPVGCTNAVTVSSYIHVVACVGINELNPENHLLEIFPNPNGGEFEIKGIQDETIFISNELGQIIETKNLNLQNNYSAKINNLQSGIYFVGNQFSKKKIAVLR